MSLPMETFNSASIGLSKLHFAKQTSKGNSTTYPSYEPLVRIDGLVSGTITPNGEIVSDYADNKTHEQAINYAASDISLEVTGLGPAGYEFVTGRIVSADGGTVMMTGQTSPNLAVAFEVLNGQRKRVRYVVYDAIFPEGETSLQTKGDGIEFSHTTLDGQIADILYEDSIVKLSDGTSVTADGIRFMTMTEGGADFNQSKWDNWFTSVQFPTNGATSLAVDFTALSFAEGLSSGQTKPTFTSAGAASFLYVVGARSTPMAGTKITEGIAIASGDTISGVTAGQYISIYGIDATSKAVSFGTHKLLSSEVK